MIKTILFKEFKRDKWILYFSFATILGLNLIIRIYEYSEFQKRYRFNNEYMDFTEYNNVYFLTVFVAVVIAMILFSYLHNKEKIDLNHRLPLNRKQIYLVRYFKGMLYYGIPYFATIISMFLIDRFVLFQMPLLSWYFILTTLKMFMIITLAYTVFVIANLMCGMVIYSLLCGIYLLYFPFIVSTILDDLMYYREYTSNSIASVISEKLFVNLPIHPGDYIIVILALAVVIVLLNIFGLKLYKLRKSEFVSTPIAIEKAKTPLKVISIYGLYFLFFYTTYIEEIFFKMLMLIITTVVCELLVNQGLRNLSYKNMGKNLGVVSLLIVLTHSYVEFGIYGNTFIRDNARDVVLMEFSYDSSMLEDDYIIDSSKLYVDLDTKVYITDQRVINEIFPVIFELEKYSKPDYYSGNISIATYKPTNASYFENDYNFTINLNNRYEKELFEYILDRAYEEQRYKTAYDLVDSGLNFGTVGMKTIKGYESFNLQKTLYPNEYKGENQDLKNALNTDLSYLSTLDVSTFDHIPITFGFYGSNSMAFPITAQAKNILEQVDIDSKPFLVYENLTIGTISLLLDYDDVLLTSAHFDTEDKSLFDYDIQIENLDVDWGDISYNIQEYSDYYLDIRRITEDDVISGEVDIMVYTGDISLDIIEEYNLKLIVDTQSHKYYFGYVVE